MMNEQTIEVLSEIRSEYNCFDESERRFYHALSMAIEALSCSEKPNRSDVVYRQDVIGMIQGVPISSGTAKAMLIFRAKELPSAQTETFEWCHDCKEYDQEQHCCHRWTKQIRKTVAELEADYPQAMKDELEYWKKRAEEAEADYIRITEGETEWETAMNMAIEALSCSEKPNNSDLISRQDAIETVNETIAPYIPYLTRKTSGIPLEMALAIKRLPPAQQWIPVSETVDIPEHEVLTCDKYGAELIGFLFENDEQWMCECEEGILYDVIAWMEKPEPYKGDTE